MNRLELNAYAKVNLGLDVLRRREDGYHEVRMIMQNIGLYDDLELTVTQEKGISVQTNREDLPTDEGNLVYKAAALLKDEFNIKDGVTLDLYKFIPVAAGMAGGSTDAAAVLKSDVPEKVADILKSNGFDVYSADEAYHANV